MVRMTDQAAFGRAYTAQLDATGPAAIELRLREIAEAVGAGRLVLMCCENLSEPGSFCHRSSWASWWEERTGNL